MVSKYLSVKSYTNKMLFWFNKYFLCYLDVYPTDSSSLSKLMCYPPVFIIGAPRSGSTLLFQILADAFEVGYLSNLHCQFWGAPALAEVLFRPLKSKRPSNYKSFHGRTFGLTEPSECGQWWYRFFRRDPAYVTLRDVEPRKMMAFRESLGRFTEAVGKPILFKNLYASIRMEPISKYVPEALFIVVKRDLFFNAVSILAGRKKALGDYGRWWSVPPPEVERLRKLPPCQQVIGQIKGIYSEIDRVISEGIVDQRKVFFVEYDELCNDTHRILDGVGKFFSDNGVVVKRRFAVPPSFPISRRTNIDSSLLKELERLVRNV